MLLAADGARARPGPESAAAGVDAYKPHIDGLRAISIIAVVAYHAGIPGFGGGFVGVDVFFVISGYLIINQITAALAAGRFSIWDFYARRALRILPPYYLMLVVTFLIALVVLRSPREFDGFIRSAALAPVFLTNVWFYLKSGYFDLDSHEKPVLHTWSLAVEEQFYLAAPIILAGAVYLARRAHRRENRVLFILAILIGLASFIGCITYTLPDHNAAFYLTHWRAWEFVVGGAIGAVSTLRFGRWNGLVSALIGLLGLALIAGSIHFFGGVLAFPGSAAAIPVLGAALVIFCGVAAPSNPAALAIATAPFRFIGRISYALYLWHWPFLVFGHILPFDIAQSIVVAAALSLSLVFAIATHYWVERPTADWRRKVALGKLPKLQRKVVMAGIGMAVALSIGTYEFGRMALIAERHRPMQAAIEASVVSGSGACLDPRGQTETACFDGSRPLGMIVGDSHALAILARVEYEAELNGDRLLSLAVGGCNPVIFVNDPKLGASNPACAPLLEKFDRITARMGAETQFAILAGIWNVVIEDAVPGDVDAEARFRRNMATLLGIFAGGGERRVLLVAPVPELSLNSPYNCLVLRTGLSLSPDFCGVPRSTVEARRRRTVAILRDLAAQHPNVRLIDPVDVLCDDRLCRPFRDGSVLYIDSNHLNTLGAKLLFEHFRADFLWAFKGPVAPG